MQVSSRAKSNPPRRVISVTREKQASVQTIFTAPEVTQMGQSLKSPNPENQSQTAQDLTHFFGASVDMIRLTHTKGMQSANGDPEQSTDLKLVPSENYQSDLGLSNKSIKTFEKGTEFHIGLHTDETGQQKALIYLKGSDSSNPKHLLQLAESWVDQKLYNMGKAIAPNSKHKPRFGLGHMYKHVPDMLQGIHEIKKHTKLPVEFVTHSLGGGIGECLARIEEDRFLGIDPQILAPSEKIHLKRWIASKTPTTEQSDTTPHVAPLAQPLGVKLTVDNPDNQTGNLTTRLLAKGFEETNMLVIDKEIMPDDNHGFGFYDSENKPVEREEGKGTEMKIAPRSTKYGHHGSQSAADMLIIEKSLETTKKGLQTHTAQTPEVV